MTGRMTLLRASTILRGITGTSKVTADTFLQSTRLEPRRTPPPIFLARGGKANMTTLSCRTQGSVYQTMTMTMRLTMIMKPTMDL